LLAAKPQSSPTSPATSVYAAIPAEAAKVPNPVRSSPESLARAKKWWKLDCEMCHGADGNGKGDVAVSEKYQLADLTDPATLKDHTDGEIFYIIKKGVPNMPPEGDRAKTEGTWDLVNYVRSLAKKKDSESKAQ
jgi:mono/diheme cytochrome c family protein